MVVVRKRCGFIREAKSTICYLRCQWRWYMVGIEVLKGFLVSGKKLKYLVLGVNMGVLCVIWGFKGFWRQYFLRSR